MMPFAGVYPVYDLWGANCVIPDTEVGVTSADEDNADVIGGYGTAKVP